MFSSEWLTKNLTQLNQIANSICSSYSRTASLNSTNRFYNILSVRRFSINIYFPLNA